MCAGAGTTALLRLGSSQARVGKDGGRDGCAGGAQRQRRDRTRGLGGDPVRPAGVVWTASIKALSSPSNNVVKSMQATS